MLPSLHINISLYIFTGTPMKKKYLEFVLNIDIWHEYWNSRYGMKISDFVKKLVTLTNDQKNTEINLQIFIPNQWMPCVNQKEHKDAG